MDTAQEELPAQDSHRIYLPLPRPLNQKGERRRAGIEIEFGAVLPCNAAKLISGLFGGTPVELNKYSYEIKGTRLGDFKVEFDARFITEGRHIKIAEKFSLPVVGLEESFIEKTVSSVLQTVIPYEVTSPPLVREDLKEIDCLVKELRSCGATGTTSSWYAAFGLHLNVEIYALDHNFLLDCMRAFIYMEDKILNELGINMARRLAQYINPYPMEYCKKIMPSSYRPTRDEFIEDYLQFNATRNHSLDMLPILAMMDETKVRAAVGNEHKVKKRPAFHVRLFDSLIDEPAWSVADAWNAWVEVERLAEDKTLLKEYGRNFVRKSGIFDSLAGLGAPLWGKA